MMLSVDALWLDLHYFPSLSYLRKVAKSQSVYIDTNQPFQKQSYQTRCHIRSAQGIQRLILPVRHPRSGIGYHQIAIDYTRPWVHSHWRTITHCYNNAPYGALLQELFFPLFHKKPLYLYQLNFQILQRICDFLDFKTTLSLESPSTAISSTDLRHAFHPKKENLFPEEPLCYYQHFSPPFIPNLSILDLLANHGPESATLLLKDA